MQIDTFFCPDFNINLIFLNLINNQGVSRHCSRESDESALRHAVELLQANGEIDDQGCLIRRNGRAKQLEGGDELKEFIELNDNDSHDGGKNNQVIVLFGII